MILETFHPLHLSLLAVTVLLPFALHFLFRKKSEVWKTNFLIVLCAVNLLIFFRIQGVFVRGCRISSHRRGGALQLAQ